MPKVTVELYGLARHHAGMAIVAAAGRTVGDVLQTVAQMCPGIAGLLKADGSISRQYLVSVDGERFIVDPDEVFPVGSRLLILGADAGG